MAKFNIKDFWKGIINQLTVKKSRERAFLFISTFILTYVSLGCLIINFINGENTIGFFALGCFVVFLVCSILEPMLFSKHPNIHNEVFTIPMTVAILVLVVSYLFLAPARMAYLLWISIIPIGMFLTFGIKKGIIGSTVLFAIILSVFYIPPIIELTNFKGDEIYWTTKAFFVIYYVMCSSIGVALSYINGVSISKLDKLRNEYYEEANTDSLTGLRNQAYYLTYINRLTEEVEIGETVGLMFIDIDDFKLYNDKYGHTVGNEVLISVANKLNEVPHALCVRWGGDEFAIIERNLTKDEFLAKANYLLKSVAGLSHHVTISIGLAYFTVGEDFDFQKIFNEADLQAIRAKGKGKNCIVFKE